MKKPIANTFISGALACTMAFALVPLPAFAQETEIETQEPSQENTSEEIAADEALSVELAEQGQLLEPNEDSSENEASLLSDGDNTNAELQANATSGYCGGDSDGKNVSWSYDGNGTLTLKGTGETDFYGEYDSWYSFQQPVPGWYSYRDKITKVNIGEGITVLSSGLLAHTSITTVNIPSTVKEIDQLVFKGCSNLTKINLNEGLETISTSALTGTNLESLSIPSTVTSLGYGIRDVLPLSKISISSKSNSLKKVGNLLYSADMKTLFWADKTFTGSYSVPQSVTKIGESAFEGIKISQVDLGSTVTEIGDGAFNLCHSLETVTISSSVKKIGRSAFSNCTNLTSAEIKPCKASIDNSLFAFCTNLKSVKIGEGITSLGERAFGGCTQLTSVTLPSSLKKVDEQSFNTCSSLTSVNFGGSETEIGKAAFANCTSLKTITLSKKLKTIGEGCFYNTPLTSLTIPDSVETIGKNAFADTTNLTVPSTLIQLEDTSYVSDQKATRFSFDVQHKQTEARKMINLVNNFRAENGVWYWNSDNKTKTYPSNLSSLTYDKDLEDLAIKRAEELVVSYSHTRPDGTSASSAAPSDMSAFGENIAMGYGSVDAVMNAWKEANESYNGQGHRRNMLSSNYNCVGYACVEYGGTYYWVQEFGNRSTPNTNTGSANDSKSAATFTLLNSKISAAETNLESSFIDLTAKGTTKKIPAVTGSVTVNSKKLNVTFNPNWRSRDTSQVSVKNGTATSLVANNGTYIFGYVNGSEVRVATSKSTIYDTMHRLYNPYSGEHLFTKDNSEYNTLEQLGWKKEGEAWKSPATSGTPVYRLFNPYSSDHHYTTDKSEYEKLGKIGWKQEGVAWYSDESKGKAVYRLYNPYVTVGTHHYTTDKNEYDFLKTVGWVQEGEGWYGLK